jgi:hypothetical protein
VTGDWLPIGHNVFVRPVRMEGVEQVVGIQYRHPDGKGGTCEGWAPFAGRYPDANSTEGWSVEGEAPLTLSPSLLCRACGHHGFIRNGQWVPA